VFNTILIINSINRLGFVIEELYVSCEVGTKSFIYLDVFHDKPRLNNKSSRKHRETRQDTRPSFRDSHEGGKPVGGGNRVTLLTFGDNSEVNTRLSANHYRSHSCRSRRVGCKTRKKEEIKQEIQKKKEQNRKRRGSKEKKGFVGIYSELKQQLGQKKNESQMFAW
jgi:hypothetical protein